MLCSLDRDDLRFQVFLQQCKVTILTEHSTRSFLFLPFPYDKSRVNKIQLTTIYKDLVVRQAVLKYSSCPFTFSSNNVSILLSTQGPYIPENQKSVINHQIYSLELQGSKKTQHLKPKIFVRFVTFFEKGNSLVKQQKQIKLTSQLCKDLLQDFPHLGITSTSTLREHLQCPLCCTLPDLPHVPPTRLIPLCTQRG